MVQGEVKKFTLPSIIIKSIKIGIGKSNQKEEENGESRTE